jgi:hypothetical protein
VSYEAKAYDNAHGDPVVVLVATGTHDVSRLVNLFAHAKPFPLSEQVRLGRRLVTAVRRHNGGKAALRLLAAHGGADFTDDTELPSPSHIELMRAIADPGAVLPRGHFTADGKSDYSEPVPSWAARAVRTLFGSAPRPITAKGKAS